MPIWICICGTKIRDNSSLILGLQRASEMVDPPQVPNDFLTCKRLLPKQRILFDYTVAIKLFLTKTQRGLPALMKAVTVENGDVSLSELGLSPEDRNMLCENVEIVFHAAATIRFDEPLKKAVLINTRGTKLMIELAKEMKHLILFVHISTAYCHLEEKVLKEKTYPPPANPHEIIKYVEYTDDEEVESMTDKILGDIPNTHTFTKALSIRKSCRRSYVIYSSNNFKTECSYSCLEGTNSRLDRQY